MTTTDVFFSKHFNGYNKKEVDLYIEKLAQAYQTAYEEYTAVCAKYDRLLEDYNTLDEQREQSKLKAEILTKALVDTETLAQKIIADAYVEADRVKAEAQVAEKAAQKIREEAYFEKTIAQVQARRLIDYAQDEADQIGLHARQNLEQSYISVQQIIGKLQELLIHKPLDAHVVEKQEKPVLIPFNAANAGK